MLLSHDHVAPKIGFDFTPMIDVVFNLLIFFLVATSFQQEEREAKIALPESVAAGPISAALREVVINIDRAGSIIVNGRVVDAATLATMLRDLVKTNPDQKVSIRGDRATPYENVARVLDVCKQQGITEPYLESVPRG